MSIKRLTFDVEVYSDPATPDLEQTEQHRVTCILGDQMRGELEGRKLRMSPKELPIHAAALWCWAAFVRLGMTDLPFYPWSESVVSLTDPDEGDEVDPTKPTAHSA